MIFNVAGIILSIVVVSLSFYCAGIFKGNIIPTLLILTGITWSLLAAVFSVRFIRGIK